MFVCLFPSQISTCHQLLHPQVLQLLVKLFETEHSQLDVMEQVHLFTRTLTLRTACKLPLFKGALNIGKLCVLFCMSINKSMIHAKYTHNDDCEWSNLVHMRT